MSFRDQLTRMQSATGGAFIAALDQSGGSTPKALSLYGIEANAYSDDAQMYALIHQMRTRIITCPAFASDRILAAILFENTMKSDIQGKPTPQFLWFEKGIVPILKVDKGLADEGDGVQLMKPIAGLHDLLQAAKQVDVFGTKMRSVIKSASSSGIKAVVDQQFDVAAQIRSEGLVPIIEPEVDIKSSSKKACEDLLLEHLTRHLDNLTGELPVMLKLTLPDRADFYGSLVAHPQVLRVVALSGGYSREVANQKLAENHGVIASFSRALTEGLSAQSSDAEFAAALDASIGQIAAASAT
ncbi:MAG: fructose bisphosphate aldolase [Proteobacteria bacterium]|nr:fructose bisphosphate aldolase [Pseudomonadota bacterium]